MRELLLDNDLALISGKFLELELPRDKRYLFKYFRTELQRQFVVYYSIFNSKQFFVNHTGFYCRKRCLQLLVVKYNRLESLYKKAKAEMDFSMVALLESGKYKYVR